METATLVIGAGAVGLACGAELSRRGRDVVVVEAHGAPGREASSRSSEVIHAGLYYPVGSWKARLCVEGRERLYQRLGARALPHAKLGKLVVATNATEAEALEGILARGRANGAGALELVDGREVAAREPRVQAECALYSPESGIFDSHALVLDYAAELEAHGGALVLATRVVGLEARRSGWRVATRGADGALFHVDAEWVVNAAGLGADRIAALAGIDTAAAELVQHPCKGDYFSVAPAAGTLTRHLVYPVPEPGGLGIHVTRDLGGRFRLGPDVEWVAEPRYDVDPSKALAFARAVGRYLPGLRAEDLAPDFAGIRAKLQAPGGPFRDFHVAEASALGAPGLVNLLGIESPGLTASPALARVVADLIERGSPATSV